MIHKMHICILGRQARHPDAGAPRAPGAHPILHGGHRELKFVNLVQNWPVNLVQAGEEAFEEEEKVLVN